MHVRFGRFELDDQRFSLMCDGAPIRVRPKVFDLLVQLLRTRDRVVLREELVLALWGTTAVGPGSLAGLVNELRQILGESGRGPTSIRTVHGRGYQFVGAVESETPRAEGFPDLDSTQTLSAVADAATDATEPRTRLARGDDGDLRDGPASAGVVEDRIRSTLARVASEGAQALLIERATHREAVGLLERAQSVARVFGFEVVRVPRPLGDGSACLVDRLLDAPIECDASSDPCEPPDRADGWAPLRPRSIARTRPRDPLAARQQDERVWRLAADRLRDRARRRPIAVLVDRIDLDASVATSPAEALLERLADARVLLVGTVDSGTRPESTPPGDGSPSRLEWLVAPPSSDADPGADRGVARTGPGLPRVLADALLTHLRATRVDPEAVAAWLRDACRSEAPTRGMPGLPADGSRRLCRVEPNTNLRRRPSRSG